MLRLFPLLTSSVLWFTLMLPPALHATPEPSLREPIRVYLDCQRGCETTYIHENIEFVEFVRERLAADVHLLITREALGPAGQRYVLEFIGQGAFEGDDARLHFETPETDVREERRRGLTQTIARGLVPYVADSPAGRALEIRYSPEGRADSADARARTDDWKGWVFRMRGNGSFNSEERSSDRTLSGSLSADRVTTDWKVRSSISTWMRSRTFTLQDGRTIESDSERHNAQVLVVRSVSEHLSLGTLTSARSSVFQNQELGARVASAVEYSYFPYAEATRRQLTVLYSAGANYFDYFETTIFGELSETLLDHNLVISYDVQERWGSAHATFEGSNYLHDISKYRFDGSAGFRIRIMRGLSVNAAARASRIRDQLYLAAGDADPEEILLRRRQLGTGYRYSGSVGLSYTFGSIRGGVVNPRFSGSSRNF